MSSRSLRSASFLDNWAINFRAAVSMNSDRLLNSPMYKSMALSTSLDRVIDVLIFIPPTYYLVATQSILTLLGNKAEQLDCKKSKGKSLRAVARIDDF
jgi:hypothetical protein